MRVLRKLDGTPLQDAEGEEICDGSLVVDDIFGEGIARGTVAMAAWQDH